MQQIVCITDARNNLSELYNKVKAEGVQIVIVRDSEPGAMIVPYVKALQDEEVKRKLLEFQWESFLKEMKKVGKRFLKEKGLKRSNLTEEQLYDLIDKI